MQKLLTFAFTVLLGTGLAIAQTTNGSTDKTTESGKTTQGGKKVKKTKEKKGGGKKVQKSSDVGTTTPAPK